MEDKNKKAVEIFDKYAESYAERYMDVSHYSTSLDAFCAHLATPHAQVLELACGPGNVTHYLLQKRPDLRILATDMAPQMLVLAQQNNPTAIVQLLDARQIGTLSQQYDGLMCGFCLPYLSREETLQLIADAAKILNPKGVICLSTMEDAYEKSGIQTSSQGDEMYMYYHESEYLTAVLQENGFELVDFRRQPYPPQGEATATDLLIVAQKSL